MTDDEYARKLDEIDRVLNDPEVPIQPALIWRLLAEISDHYLLADTILSQQALPTSLPKGGGRFISIPARTLTSDRQSAALLLYSRTLVRASDGDRR